MSRKDGKPMNVVRQKYLNYVASGIADDPVFKAGMMKIYTDLMIYGQSTMAMELISKDVVFKALPYKEWLELRIKGEVE